MTQREGDEATTIALATLRDVPDDVDLPDDALDIGAPIAAWAPQRETLRVITWGSSSCPPPVVSLVALTPNELALTFGALTPRPCTADFAPTTHVIAVPEGVAPGAVTVVVSLERRDAAAVEHRIPIADATAAT